MGLVTARLPDWISEHYTACTLRLLGGGGGGALSSVQLWQHGAPGLDWGQDTTLHTLVTTGDTAHCCGGKGDEEAVQRPDTGQPENMCCLDAEKRKSMFIVY